MEYENNKGYQDNKEYCKNLLNFLGIAEFCSLTDRLEKNKYPLLTLNFWLKRYCSINGSLYLYVKYLNKDKRKALVNDLLNLIN